MLHKIWRHGCNERAQRRIHCRSIREIDPNIWVQENCAFLQSKVLGRSRTVVFMDSHKMTLLKISVEFATDTILISKIVFWQHVVCLSLSGVLSFRFVHIACAQLQLHHDN